VYSSLLLREDDRMSKNHLLQLIRAKALKTDHPVIYLKEVRAKYEGQFSFCLTFTSSVHHFLCMHYIIILARSVRPSKD